MSAQNAILTRRWFTGGNMLQGLWIAIGGIVVFLCFGMVWAGFAVLISWFLEGDNGKPNEDGRH